MKPEDLKPPFPRDDRQIAIHDRVWYVPERTQTIQNFVFPGWQHETLFNNSHPVYVEYCSGNGAWIAAKAQEDAQINWIGIEKKFDRVRKIWSKVKNLELNNLVVLCGEAHNATKQYFPSNSVDHIFINFPDPWPKNRHAKNRLIQENFVKEMCRILKSKGSLTFVTDDVPYSEWFIEILQASGLFRSLFESPYFITNKDEYGTSYFDQLWRSKGRTIRYHQYIKNE